MDAHLVERAAVELVAPHPAPVVALVVRAEQAEAQIARVGTSVAGAGEDRGVMLWIEGERADGERGHAVEQRRPELSAVPRPPHAAAGRADIERAGRRRVGCDRGDPSAVGLALVGAIGRLAERCGAVRCPGSENLPVDRSVERERTAERREACEGTFESFGSLRLRQAFQRLPAGPEQGAGGEGGLRVDARGREPGGTRGAEVALANTVEIAAAEIAAAVDRHNPLSGHPKLTRADGARPGRVSRGRRTTQDPDRRDDRGQCAGPDGPEPREGPEK